MGYSFQLAVAIGAVLFGSASGLLSVAHKVAPVLLAQELPQPTPEIYHWVLPINQLGIEVATLHPKDCYVVRQAEGVGYFGRPPRSLVELQRQLLVPSIHKVDRNTGLLECKQRACVAFNLVAAAIQREITSVNQSQVRTVDHRPSPLDSFYGGAYTDVGSSERERFRNLPEQRMIFQHLVTTRRDNCYEAELPRTLTIHVRDHERQSHRTGVYQGFLYIEHHHPDIYGQKAAE